MIVINAQRNEFLNHLEKIEKYNKEYADYIHEYICRSSARAADMTRKRPEAPTFETKYIKREPCFRQNVCMPGSNWIKVIEPILGYVRVKTTKEEKEYANGELKWRFN